MNYEMRVAKEKDKELFSNLLNMYYSELGLYSSEFQDVDARGYFDAHAADNFFDKNNSILPLIIVAYDDDGFDRIIGMAAVAGSPYESADFCWLELYVVGYYRGRGAAEAAVSSFMHSIPGRYIAAVQTANRRAAAFFRKVFSAFPVYNESMYNNGGEFLMFYAAPADGDAKGEKAEGEGGEGTASDENPAD